MTDIEYLKEIIENSDNIVFFGGAGVSTESGIPDFRGEGGLYDDDEEEKYGESPENILSHSYFFSNPEGFYSYYKNNMIYSYAEPNDAHIALARLEKEGKLKAVITQNIDGLHQMAGSENVIELHGSSLRNFCVGCGKEHSLSYVMESEGAPTCQECGKIVRPDVVLYGEGLPSRAFGEAEELIYEADVLIVGGTSLTVHPASSLIESYQGEHLIIINKDPTPYDGYAELIIREPIGEVFKEIL